MNANEFIATLRDGAGEVAGFRSFIDRLEERSYFDPIVWIREEVPINEEQKGIAESFLDIAHKIAAVIGAPDLTLLTKWTNHTLKFRVISDRFSTGILKVDELSQILRLYATILPGAAKSAGKLRDYIAERPSRDRFEHLVPMPMKAPNGRDAHLQTLLQDKMITGKEGQAVLHESVRHEVGDLQAAMSAARAAIDPKKLEQEARRVLEIWEKFADGLAYGASASLVRKGSRITLQRPSNTPGGSRSPEPHGGPQRSKSPPPDASRQ